MTNGWGGGSAGATVRPAGSAERDHARAAERERRAQERIAAATERSAQRQADRNDRSRSREEERERRTAEEKERLATRVVAREEQPRRRSSGALARTGEKTAERDTRHYATAIDLDRIRELSRRGATIDGLAKAFGITVDAVEDALADA